MTSTSTNTAHATAIGTFYYESLRFIEKYKVEGKQKLQKIVGEDLFYKKGKDWYLNNSKIIKMSTPELKKLTSKIKNA